MPVYNNEKFISEAIDSLINQIFDDIEIIIIDDGSTDNCPQICDDYAKNDSRIKVVHKENAGMGVAYNLGMDMAQGKYIGFLESDDFTEKHMYKDLYDIAEEFDAQVVKSAWFEYNTKNSFADKNWQMIEFNSWQVFSPKERPWIITKQPSVWSAIYRTDYLRNNGIRYLETPGASYQDVAFTYKAILSADKIVVTSNAYVHYRLDNENSSINSKEKADAIFWEYEEVDKFFASHPEIKEWANEDKLVRQYFDYSWNYNRIDDSLKPQFVEKARKKFKQYLDNGEITIGFYQKSNMNFFNNILQL